MDLFKPFWDMYNKNGNFKVPINALPQEIQDCLKDGDLVHDHHNGRQPFLIGSMNGNYRIVLNINNEKSEVEIRKCLDATGGYGTGILGDKITEIADKTTCYIETSSFTTDEYHSIERMKLSQKLLSMISHHTNTAIVDWSVTFPATGTEANDFALQMIFFNGINIITKNDKYPRQDTIVAAHGNWHGWSAGIGSLLDRQFIKGGLEKISKLKVVHVRYGDEGALLNLFKTNGGSIRGVFVEGLIGDGGIMEASISWWKTLRTLCTEYNSILAVDEILTGFRCGGILALPCEIIPDIITMGKALGGGLLPIAATIWKKNILKPPPGIGGRTFNARPWNARVALEIIEYIERNNLFKAAQIKGEQISRELKQLIAKRTDIFKEIRFKGLMIGIELQKKYNSKVNFIRSSLLKNGLFVEVEQGTVDVLKNTAHSVNKTLRLTPPLTITEQNQEFMFKSFKKFIDDFDTNESGK